MEEIDLIDFGNYNKGDQALTKKTPDWKIVENPKKYPYNCFGNLICKFSQKLRMSQSTSGQFSKVGTASIISPVLLLTSAHVLFDNESKQIAEYAEFYPFFGKEKDGFKVKIKISNKNFMIFPAYKKSNNLNRQFHDIALLLLEKQDKINLDSYLKIFFNYSWQKYQNNFIKIVGNRGERQKEGIYEQSGKSIRQKDSNLFYQHSTEQKYSGTPILLEEKKQSGLIEYLIIGVHKGTIANLNYCLLMMRSTRKIINKLLEQKSIEIQAKQNEKEITIFQKFLNIFANDKNQLSYSEKQLEWKQYANVLIECNQLDQDQTKYMKQYSQNSRFKHPQIPIDMKQFTRYNWKHLTQLELIQCNIDDLGWSTLIQHADQFPLLQKIWIYGNEIKIINSGDLDQFPQLKQIWFRSLFGDNPLDKQSQLTLLKYKENHPTVTVHYNEESWLN